MMCKSIFKKIVGATTVAVVLGVGYGNVYANTNRALNGTWVSEHGDEEITFNNGNFERSRNGCGFNRGTYVANNRTITMTVTHVHGCPLQRPERWYSRDEAGFDSYYLFAGQVPRYLISGNTLTLSVCEMDCTEEVEGLYNDGVHFNTAYTKR